MQAKIWLIPESLSRFSAIFILSSAATGSAFGQNVPEYDNTVIEEIVVTTRKREENLQEVPISIGVFSAEQIMRVGIRDLGDITKLSPSLQFDKSYSQNAVRVTIRGLSNTRGRSNVAFLIDGIDVSSETTGTNSGSPMLVNQRLLTDVERIEVVRGPQSALYGRAAFAGAINYVTKNPGDEYEFNMSLDVSQYDKQEVNVGVGGPLTDTLGFRLTGVAWTDDGTYENVVSGNGFGGGEGTGIAGTLLWEPVDSFSLKTRLAYTDDKYTPSAIGDNSDKTKVTVAVPQEAIDAGVTNETSVDLTPFVGDADGLEVRASEDFLTCATDPLTGERLDPVTGQYLYPETCEDYPGNTLEVFRASMIASWDVSNYTISSYSGYTDADMSQRYDLDRQAEGRPDTILGHGDIDTFGTTEQISQEFRIASNWDNSPVQLTAGVQYWHEDRDDFSRSIAVTCWNLAFCGPNQVIGPPLNPLFPTWQSLYAAVLENSPGFRAPIYTETDHRSVYLMAEWDMTDTLSLTVEDRFVKEDFEATLPDWASCFNPHPQNASLTFEFRPQCARGEIDTGKTSTDYNTPKVTLEWQVSEEVLLYGLVAKGAKPAGVNLVRVPVNIGNQDIENNIFAPEKMWSYEVGAKTQWTGALGALVVNAAGFYQDYTDKQTNTQQEKCGIDQNGVEQCQTVGQVTNASAAWVTGFEIETNWATPLEGLSLGLGYTWLDSEYDDFKDPTRSAGRIAIAGECAGYEDIPKVNGRPHCIIDLSGNRLEFMPENALVLTGRYENNLFSTGAQWYLEANASYQDERFTSSDNYTVLDDFWLADMRFGVFNDQWNIIAYVNNVFDDNTISSAGGNTDVAAGYVGAAPDVVPPTLATAFLPQPRTAGIRIQYRYR